MDQVVQPSRVGVGPGAAAPPPAASGLPMTHPMATATGSVAVVGRGCVGEKGLSRSAESSASDPMPDIAAAATTVPSRVSLSPDFTSSASISSCANDDRGVGETLMSLPPASVAPSVSATIVAGAPSGDVSSGKSDSIAQSASASAEKKGLDAESSPRRTGRKRTSTTMIIDGHVVKTANNYVVTGDNYTFGAFTADAPKAKAPKPAAAPSKPAQPRKRPAHLDERARHNEVIKGKMRGNDEANRRDFMTNHYDALEPFIDLKVKKHLQANRASAKPEPERRSVLGSQPDSVTTTLRDYQLIGLDWMVKMHSRGMPFICGDEMGLGKTLQSIALICHLKENDPSFSGPCLVVCPLSVLYSWCFEVRKHAPSLKHFRFHASDPADRMAQKDTMLRDILNYDIVITTYEMAKNPAVVSLFRGVFFNLCILDEGHVIKSLTSQISEAVRKIHSRGRVILTGTPLQNNLVELYAILNYLYPQYFTTAATFAYAFNITLNQIDSGMLLKANKLLKLFMIRRLKGEVERLMPKKIETKILCPLSSSQIFWYKGFLMNEIESLVKLTEAQGEEEDASKGKHNMLRNLIMQLRKVCLHPYLFDFAEVDSANTSVEELVATSGKLAVLDKLLRSLFRNGHRTCIFSQFTSMLNIIEDYCVHRGWRYCRFDGGTPRAQRNHIINRFNAPGSDIFIFLMSTKSGGLGINLQTADTCILYDSDWNPQPDLQAMARVHRIGQTKTVHVYRLISAGTVEERVVERAEKKLYLDQMVNRGTSNCEMDDGGTSLSTAELLASLKFGSNAVFSSSNDLPTESDIEKVTDRTRSEDSSDGLLKGGMTNTAMDFNKDKELTDTRKFCGVDFRKLREEKEGRCKGKGKHKFLDKLKQDWKEVQTGEDELEFGKGKRNKRNRLLQVYGEGSGWGSSHVPVLAMNNYELSQGEPSAWGRETKKVTYVQTKKSVQKFINQDFCQFCGDGGTLIECPRCPISVHASCCGIKLKDFQCCTHHNCVLCSKNASGAGGLIYRCQSCPNAYCPDCLPGEPYRYLDINVPRFEKLGFEGNNLFFYIHCSKQCEEVAKAEFGFKMEYNKPTCPSSLDVMYAFGKDAMEVKDMAKMFKEKAAGTWMGRGTKSHPYIQGSMPKEAAASSAASGAVNEKVAVIGRVSPRKRKLSPKAASAAFAKSGIAALRHGAGDIIDLSFSPPSKEADLATGYI